MSWIRFAALIFVPVCIVHVMSLALLKTYVTDLEDIRDVPDGIIKFQARRSVCFVIKNDE